MCFVLIAVFDFTVHWVRGFWLVYMHKYLVQWFTEIRTAALLTTDEQLFKKKKFLRVRRKNMSQYLRCIFCFYTLSCSDDESMWLCRKFPDIICYSHNVFHFFLQNFLLNPVLISANLFPSFCPCVDCKVPLESWMKRRLEPIKQSTTTKVKQPVGIPFSLPSFTDICIFFNLLTCLLLIYFAC